MDAREATFLTLRETYDNGKYSNLALDSAIKKYELGPREIPMFTRLYYGCIERKLTLEHIISRYSNREIKKIDKTVLLALHICIYQLLYMDSVPDYSAVDESVNLVKRHGKSSAAAFVNAVARSFIRYNKKISYPEDELDMLSVKYSVSRDIASEIKKDYPQDYEKILESFFVLPGMSVRLNPLKEDADEIVGRITEDGNLNDSESFKVFFAKTYGNNPLISGQLIRDGYVYIQDDSSADAVDALLPLAGQTLVDVCAAPGGKSFCAAMLMKNEGKIYSFDLHKNKLSLIKSGAEKLGIDIIEVMQFDSRNVNVNLIAAADRVICDVPCSGIGVIAKKPDIRYKKLSDFLRLRPTQSEILNSSVEYLKNGGRICYSTCTIRKAENEEITGEFLSKNKNFKMIEEKTFIPDGTRDGFYYAVMEKVSD